MESHTLSPRRQLHDKGLRVVLYFCGFLTCALLVLIIGYIFYRGVPFISWELLSTQSSYINDTIGILPNILNTLYIILLSMVIVLPLGVGAAIYLTEYATNRRLVAVLHPDDGIEDRCAGRRPDPGGDDPAHHRPHHPGEPEDRAGLLPGGRPGHGRR